MEKFKWAYIGSGAIAKKTAKQMLCGNHEIVSVYSRKLSNAQKLADRVGGKAYDNIADCVKDADCVYICTPNKVHAQNALDCIDAGKNVLVEKPFSLTADEAKEVFKRAKEKNVYVAEAMWTWFNPVALKVKEWIDNGKIGKVRSITANFEVNLTLFGANKRLFDPQGGGAMYDLGVYPLTYAYYLLGAPKETSVNLVMKKGVDVSNSVTLTYDNATAHLRSAINKLRTEKAVIVGDKGKIVVPRFHCANSAKLISDNPETFRGGGNYLEMFNRVADEIKSGKTESTFVPPHSTIEIMKLIEKMLTDNG